MSKFSWKNKTAIYIGRFQPFHDGHKAMFLKALKKNGQVCILVMDLHGINKKILFRFSVVKKKKINEALHEYRSNYKIIKIPVVSEVVYGRQVGYKIKKYLLPKKLKKISATKIRKKLFHG